MLSEIKLQGPKLWLGKLHYKNEVDFKICHCSGQSDFGQLINWLRKYENIDNDGVKKKLCRFFFAPMIEVNNGNISY